MPSLSDSGRPLVCENGTGGRSHRYGSLLDGRSQGPPPVAVSMQHVSGDVLALIVRLISKWEAANLATTCKALYAKLPHQLRR